MYGTVAKMKANPGSGSFLVEMGRQLDNDPPPGMVAMMVYQMDADPNEYMMAVVFEDRESYVRNAESPEQHARYEEYRAWLAEDPEWHDGEVVNVRGSLGA